MATITIPLVQRIRPRALTTASFLLPLLLWMLVSYVPGVWQPNVKITDPGDVAFFRQNMLIGKEQFALQTQLAIEGLSTPPSGIPANPIYLPAPHEVAIALYTSLTTPPLRRSEVWFYQSIWHSITIIFWGFLYSCLLGLPLGKYRANSMNGSANTTRRLDVRYLEAAQTLGAKKIRQLVQVVLPGILPDLYKDLRILLGWAWTYLIVAELIGTSSGITWFITQQARYKNFDMVFAALIILGVIGLLSDLLLERMGLRLFPWQEKRSGIN